MTSGVWEEEAAAGGKNGSKSKEDDKARQVNEFDVDKYRAQEFAHIRKLYTGEIDPSVIARLSSFKRSRINALLYECEMFKGQVDVAPVLALIHNYIKGQVDSRKPLERFGDNLSKPNAERSWVERMMNRK